MPSRVRMLQSAINGKFHISSGMTVASRVAAVFLMGIMFIVVARTLGPSGQGVIATLVAVITIAIQFGNMGLYASNIRFVGADRSLFPKACGNSLTIGSILGFFVCLAIIGAYLAFPGFFPEIPFFLLVIYALSLPFSLEIILFQGLLLSVNDIFRYNALVLFRAIALLAGVTIILLIFSAGITELVIYLVLVEILFAFAYVLVARRKQSFGFKLDTGYLSKMIGYGIKVYLATQVTYLVLKFDILMVNYFLGSSQAGLYSVSSKVADMAKMLPETVALIFFPKAAALGVRAKPFANRVLIWISIIMAPLCGIIYFISGPLTILFLTEDYSGSVRPIIILLPGIFFISLAAILMNYFAAKKMPWKVVSVPFLGLLANVSLNMALLPAYGIDAAAFTSTISYTLMFLLLFLMYLKSD